MVMEKPWNMQNWPKVMEFCYQHGIVPILSPNGPNLYGFFATTQKLSIDFGSPYFLTFSARHCECKINKRGGHGKLRNGYGKVMEKHLVKSVGTLCKVVH